MRPELKRPFRDGTYALEMDVLSPLARLAASVPPPKLPLVRSSGVLAPASPWRPLVIRRYPRASPPCPYPTRLRRARRPHCGGRMKLRALVRDHKSIERFLRHQGLWSEPLGSAH